MITGRNLLEDARPGRLHVDQHPPHLVAEAIRRGEARLSAA